MFYDEVSPVTDFVSLGALQLSPVKMPAVLPQ